MALKDSKDLVDLVYLADGERVRDHLNVDLRLAGGQQVARAGPGSHHGGRLRGCHGVGRLRLEVHFRLDEEPLHFDRAEVADAVCRLQQVLGAVRHVAAEAQQRCLHARSSWLLRH